MKNTKTKTEQILMIMHILAYVAFIGFLVEAGAILISYIVSCINPEGARHLYNGLSLDSLKQFSFPHYTLHVAIMILLLLLKASVWLMVIKTISKLSLRNPFKMEVAIQLEAISYVLLGIWAVALASSAHSGWLFKISGIQYGNEVSGEYLFGAGLVFIISQVFRRGVEIQKENELTV